MVIVVLSALFALIAAISILAYLLIKKQDSSSKPKNDNQTKTVHVVNKEKVIQKDDPKGGGINTPDDHKPDCAPSESSNSKELMEEKRNRLLQLQIQFGNPAEFRKKLSPAKRKEHEFMDEVFSFISEIGQKPADSANAKRDKGKEKVLD